MKNTMGNKLKKLLLLVGVVGLTLSAFNTTNVFARDRDDTQERLQTLKDTPGKGWQIKSSGGLVYMDPSDKTYWFSLSGVIRADETLFMLKSADRQPLPPVPAFRFGPGLPSGSHIRKAEIDLVGGIGTDWNYTVGLDFILGQGVDFHFSDTWVAYSGIADNIEIFIGRHSANWFGLDNSISTSWYPFLERSAMANAFYPGDGLGLLVDYWTPCSGFTFLALQPDAGNRVVTGIGAGFSTRVRNFGNDKWLGLARYTVAPVHEKGDVWHFGVSGMYRQHVAFLGGLGLMILSLPRDPMHVDVTRLSYWHLPIQPQVTQPFRQIAFTNSMWK